MVPFSVVMIEPSAPEMGPLGPLELGPFDPELLPLEEEDDDADEFLFLVRATGTATATAMTTAATTPPTMRRSFLRLPFDESSAAVRVPERSGVEEVGRGVSLPPFSDTRFCALPVAAKVGATELR